MGCELCMPWGRSEIDEIDYTTPTGCSKLRKIAEEYMKTTSSNMMPTPYRRLVYSDNLQKIDLLIEKSEYEDWPNQFQVERSDDRADVLEILAGRHSSKETASCICLE